MLDRRDGSEAGRAWFVGALVLVAILVIAAILFGPAQLVALDERGPGKALAGKDLVAARDAARKTIIQAVGGLFFLLTAYFTFGQLRAARGQLEATRQQLQNAREELEATRDQQVVERYTRAIEQLGHASLDVRVGAIYALGRIARDSTKDRLTIAVVLAEYVRQRLSPTTPLDPDQERDELRSLPTLRQRAPDSQAALDVLAEFARVEGATSRRLNLTYTDLRRANLGRARFAVPPDFEGARLAGTFLDDADLTDARLDRASLVDTPLRRAFLTRAEIRRAYVAANLNDAFLIGADLSGSDLSGSNDIAGADFADAICEGTVWPPGVDPPCPSPA